MTRYLGLAEFWFLSEHLPEQNIDDTHPLKPRVIGTYTSGRALENVQRRGRTRTGHPPIARASLSAGCGHVDRRR